MEQILSAAVVFLLGMACQIFISYYQEQIKVWSYNKVDKYEKCTVEILSSTKHDHCEISWYRGREEDLPIMYDNNKDSKQA